MLDNKLFKEPTLTQGYMPTPEEKTRTDFVRTRIAAMQTARSAVDSQRDVYQTMIDAAWVPYPDERTSSTVPLASSIIELAVSEALKIRTEYEFVPESSKYMANARAFEYVWRHLWKKNNWDTPIDEAEYICFGFGNVPLFVGYESYTKVQKDAVVDPETGTIDWVEKNIEKDGIIMQLGDIRQFYIDNQAIRGIEDASDCAYRQWMGFDKFQNLKTNPLYKNIEHVKPRGYSNDYKSFITKSDAVREGNYVERWLYWNVEKDVYIEIANGIEVREHPMMNTIDGEKALPRVWRGLGKKNYSIYSRGLCEPLLMFNSEINNLREMLMDGIRKSNSQVLAIGNGIKFNGRGFSYDNQILTFDGKLGSDNFQQISGTPPNQAIFSYVEQLYRDISMYVGIDIQNVMGEPDLTAYQTEVKRESSQKRMNVYLKNRDMAYNRLAELLQDQILTWFPIKDADGMYPELETDGVEIKQTDEGKPDKIKQKRGKSMFQVTPEILRDGKWNITAATNSGAATIAAVDREQRSKFMTDLGMIGQQLALAKEAGLDVDSVLDTKEELRNLAADYGLTPKDSVGNDEELEAGKKAFMNQLMEQQKNIGGQPQMPTDQGPIELQDQQQPLAPNTNTGITAQAPNPTL